MQIHIIKILHDPDNFRQTILAVGEVSADGFFGVRPSWRGKTFVDEQFGGVAGAEIAACNQRDPVCL